ncbi:hypothetical protein CFOL_v3_27815 [Cephalotus follicularis]|uniref:Protein BIG GRAIN 1-like B n=1 Tax=Cephalotus follicularis TaxID=3775 RepID=A0A1Q3CW53_CEPFO|nr:hypothetical protein CFOL_v3_27815 [Cephalotus follicularis]
MDYYTETTTATATTMPMIKKLSNACTKGDNTSNLHRAIMIESWMEKQSSRNGSTKFFSTSSSSDSSSGGVLSSSEDSCFKQNPRTVSGFSRQRSKQLRSDKCLNFEQRNVDKQPKPKCEGGFTKTKLKALKIYGELKKVKQPTSPGGRIASFLNSIFNYGNTKKVARCSIGAMDDVSYERKSKSTSSSTTSFYGSCLSKAPTSRGKYSNGVKRSVRFCPVSTVIVDEDSRPCGQKWVYEDDPKLMPTPTVQKVVKSSNYGVNTTRHDFPRTCGEDDEEDDGDALSYSSSDLFELDHIIGIGKYREELPVFETTSMKTNQAIASGFIM